MAPAVQERSYSAAYAPPKEETPHPPVAGFTAVNGRATPPEPIRTDSTMEGHVQPQPPRSNQTEQPQDGRPSSSYQDDRHYVTSNGDRAPNQRLTPPGSIRQETYLMSPGKRKRSPEAEGTLATASVSPDRVANNAQRRRIDEYDSTAGQMSPDSTIPSHARPTPPGTAPPSISNTLSSAEAQSTEEQWYNRQNGDAASSEARLAEALQRESQNMDHQNHAAEETANADGTVPASQAQPEQSSTTEITRAGVQVDPKKRKRVFSNRTKTGCQTCRRRKKKCDEGRPECMNCIRGGFVCEGYTTKATWTKPGLSKGPIPLQAKDGYDHQNIYQRNVTDLYDRSSVPQGPDGARGRPIVVDEVDDRGNPRPAWGPQGSWPNEPHRQYSREHSSAVDYSKQSSAVDTPHGQLRDYPDPNSTHQQSSRPSGLSINTSQSANLAQLALQHPSSSSTRSIPPPPHSYSEKDKMLAGELYLPFNSFLVDERERCRAALWRFNNAANPAVGVSREERARLFRAILEPLHLRRQASPSNPIGSLGKNVCVEAPFTCDYGYNINVGDDVVIGSNCTVLDPCIIQIGARCIIGPNVNIYGNAVSTDPRMRSGSQGHAYGRRITIDEDVFIGGGATILPGITIGRGATVGAGSVVTKNVPPYTVAVGNPAEVKHGAGASSKTKSPQQRYGILR